MLKKYRSIIQCALSIVFVVVSYYLAAHYDTFERIFHLTQKYEQYQLDELFSVLIILPFIFSVFSFIKWKEYKKEAEARQKAETNLEHLLKDVHHRVKNNLQIMSSLLQLQDVNCSNETTSLLLKESQNRIHAMAMIHEKLYQSENLNSVDIAEYIKSFANEIQSVYGNEKCLEIKVTDVVHVYMNINTVIPVGLILSELVSNAFKYAFQKTSGVVEVCFEQRENHDCVLKIKDNGSGLPDGFSLSKHSSLGLSLVQNLVETQLRGKMNYIVDAGTMWVITFNSNSLM